MTITINHKPKPEPKPEPPQPIESVVASSDGGASEYTLTARGNGRLLVELRAENFASVAFVNLTNANAKQFAYSLLDLVSERERGVASR